MSSSTGWGGALPPAPPLTLKMLPPVLPPILGGSTPDFPRLILGGGAQNPQGGAAPPMCSPPDIMMGGELKGEHFFLRIRSAPPQTGGEHKGEHFGKLGAAGENFRVLASDVDKKYTNFIKLRQIIVKLAPQAKILRIGSKILKITSAPPQNGGEHRGEHFQCQGGSRGERSPPSCGARHRSDRTLYW